MECYRETRLQMLVFVFGVFFMRVCVSDTFPKAQNVTWSSTNFKTMLTWDPKPKDYSYTVEFYEIGESRERTPHCITSTETECDLTAELKNLKASYKADILSEPMRGVTSDLIEHPYTTSERFSPYLDTVIGRPEFKLEVSSDKRKITLHVTDVPTALYNEQNERRSIRDVFKDELQYKVIYRKAKSTGKGPFMRNMYGYGCDNPENATYLTLENHALKKCRETSHGYMCYQNSKKPFG